MNHLTTQSNHLPAVLPDSFYGYTPSACELIKAMQQIGSGYTLTFDGYEIHIDKARKALRDTYGMNELLEDLLFHDKTSPAGKLYGVWLAEEVRSMVKCAFDDYGVKPSEWSEVE